MIALFRYKKGASTTRMESQERGYWKQLETAAPNLLNICGTFRPQLNCQSVGRYSFNRVGLSGRLLRFSNSHLYSLQFFTK